MLISLFTLAALAGAAMGSPLRRDNLTEAASVDLGYEIHTATANVRRIPVPASCITISADLSCSRLEATTFSPTSPTRSSLPVTCGFAPLASLRGTALSSTTAWRT